VVKVCIMCRSVLLESSLKRILRHHVTTFGECDVVLTDQRITLEKPTLLISTQSDADIKKPFTHSSLMVQLEKFSNRSRLPKELEQRIHEATGEFVKNLSQIIAAYYENK